ncbi:MAG: manganese efflux pump [Clostridia bacterium]|nr:manganese efflux pump [Clostridia bacterium]
MDVLFLISTALSVSADSFLCGLSLYVPLKDKNKAVIIIAVSVLVLCFTGAFLGLNLGRLFSRYANLIGGILLMIIGLIEVFEHNGKELITALKQKKIFDYFLVGIAVGLDGLVGSFTLSLLGYNLLLVVLTITVLHVMLLYVSISISTEFLLKHSAIVKSMPALIFMLGIYKVLC